MLRINMQLRQLTLVLTIKTIKLVPFYFFEEKLASWNKIFWKKLLVARVYHGANDVLCGLPNNLKSRSVIIG